ncbi:MAG: NAD-dependent epimerase/dehydratase family protein [Alphaproteobacteria bacterium]|nr:NAD-dependent epimerase/dehydratase family protein [Alphaproteobacteria bacterium]
MNKKVLITGMAGLLGSNFTRHLLKEGYDVVGIDDFSGGYKENLVQGVRCVNINLADLDSVDKFFKEECPDYVYHFAAYAAEGLSPFIRKYNYTNNLICSANLITSSINHGIKKFIFTSSMATYGADNIPPFVETMQPKPLDPYGIAKYAVEMDLKTAHDQFGLNYSIIRPHNIVGRYQNIWDRYRNVIGIWMRKSMNKEPITIFGDGLQTRAFSDVEYYYKPFEKLMYDYDGEIFNLGADKERTINEAAELVKKCANNFGFNPEIVHLEARHEAKFAFCNHDKAKKLLDFHDDTDLEKTINNMFEWALTQPNHPVKNMSYETEKNIYSFWR